MKHHKRYKSMAKANQRYRHQSCARVRGKRHVPAVMCEHMRLAGTAPMVPRIQRPPELVKEREVDLAAPRLPLTRGVWISRLIVVCVVTFLLGASLLFLWATPYHARNASMAEVLVPIYRLSFWHVAVIGSLSAVGGVIASKLMYSKMSTMSVRFS